MGRSGLQFNLIQMSDTYQHSITIRNLEDEDVESALSGVQCFSLTLEASRIGMKGVRIVSTYLKGNNLLYSLKLRDNLFRQINSFGFEGCTGNDLPYGISIPTAICVFLGEIFVLDTQNLRICVFQNDGTFLRSWGSPGKQPGEFSASASDLCCAEGNLYVSDTGNERIQVFDSRTGSFKFQLVSRSQSFVPIGISILPLKRQLLCADVSSNTIFTLDMSTFKDVQLDEDIREHDIYDSRISVLKGRVLFVCACNKLFYTAVDLAEWNYNENCEWDWDTERNFDLPDLGTHGLSDEDEDEWDWDTERDFELPDLGTHGFSDEDEDDDEEDDEDDDDHEELGFVKTYKHELRSLTNGSESIIAKGVHFYRICSSQNDLFIADRVKRQVFSLLQGARFRTSLCEGISFLDNNTVCTTDPENLKIRLFRLSKE